MRFHKPHKQHHHPMPGFRNKHRFLIGRFIGLMFFVTLPLLAAGALGGFFWRHSIGAEFSPHIGRMLFCGLPIMLLLLAMLIGANAFRKMSSPLANVMAVADSMAEGDLSARVPERGIGEFRRLARSFNRMATELERAEQQRRSLTADVAHELRTPLHIIQGNLEGVLDGVYEPSSEHITATLDETHLLARLVDDLQTLTLAEAGQLPLKVEAVDIPELLEDVRTSFSGQAEAAGIDLQIALGGDAQALMITGDADRLDQVLSNLVANALRHTTSGGSITMNATPTPMGVRISMSDNGEGIPPEDLPYVFDRFWKGDRARQRADGSGSGLGLAIARQLVQLHGGVIEVESELCRGTTFWIDLPAEQFCNFGIQ